MKERIKSSLRWNHIDRKFYKGLYEMFGNKAHLRQYYSRLHQVIAIRGKYCPYYKHQRSGRM